MTICIIANVVDVTAIIIIAVCICVITVAIFCVYLRICEEIF